MIRTAPLQGGSVTLHHLAIVEWSLFTKKLHQLSWHRVFWALHPLQAAVTFLLGTLGVAVRTWAQRRKEDRALTWPIADAVIQAVRVRPKMATGLRLSIASLLEMSIDMGSSAATFARRRRQKPLLQRYATSRYAYRCTTGKINRRFRCWSNMSSALQGKWQVPSNLADHQPS